MRSHSKLAKRWQRVENNLRLGILGFKTKFRSVRCSRHERDLDVKAFCQTAALRSALFVAFVADSLLYITLQSKSSIDAPSGEKKLLLHFRWTLSFESPTTPRAQQTELHSRFRFFPTFWCADWTAPGLSSTSPLLRHNPTSSNKWQAWRHRELSFVEGYVFQQSSIKPNNSNLRDKVSSVR